MLYPLQDRYINLLTDFGFKRMFGTEPNKQLLIDFLNTLLPDQHQVADLAYKSTENLSNTHIDRKAIFDIYCQTRDGSLNNHRKAIAAFFPRISKSAIALINQLWRIALLRISRSSTALALALVIF